MKLIKCGQFSKSFKTSQKLTALLTDEQLAPLPQIALVPLDSAPLMAQVSTLVL
jgi:hypothetical protein